MTAHCFITWLITPLLFNFRAFKRFNILFWTIRCTFHIHRTCTLDANTVCICSKIQSQSNEILKNQCIHLKDSLKQLKTELMIYTLAFTLADWQKCHSLALQTSHWFPSVSPPWSWFHLYNSPILFWQMTSSLSFSLHSVPCSCCHLMFGGNCECKTLCNRNII